MRPSSKARSSGAIHLIVPFEVLEVGVFQSVSSMSIQLSPKSHRRGDPVLSIRTLSYYFTQLARAIIVDRDGGTDRFHVTVNYSSAPVLVEAYRFFVRNRYDVGLFTGS